MSTPEELNRLLSECCERLVDCSSIIREMPLEPAKENIYRVGKALAEISEIRSVLYRAHPQLKPEKWDEPPSEEDFSEMYEEALRQAAEHIEAGKPREAVKTLESYIFIGPTEKYENMARQEMEKLRREYGV